MNHTQYFVELARDYIQGQQSTQRTTDIICAFAGGSVGRGEADSYSDLDLNIYTSDDNQQPYSKNIVYKDNIIQLHVHGLPRMEEIFDQPWDFRFLTEASVIFDPDGKFLNLITEACEYFYSKPGRELMLLQSKQVVNERLSWLTSCVDNKEWVTSGIAINAAWTDAGFAYSFFKLGSLSTGGLLPILRTLDFYKAYRDIRFTHSFIETERLLEALKMYRAYLCKANGDEFALGPIQDQLAARKAARYEEAGDFENMAWQLGAEALWCYLSANTGVSFEQHFNSVPENIRIQLRMLGFRPYTEEEINILIQQVKELMNLTEVANEIVDDWGDHIVRQSQHIDGDSIIGE